MCEEYNGWKNRETWAIQLHLSNNEGDYEAMSPSADQFVREQADYGDDPTGRTAVGLMADYIQAWTEQVYEQVLDGETIPTPEARMFVADVGSWWRADFYEIATHWIDDAREQVTA